MKSLLKYILISSLIALIFKLTRLDLIISETLLLIPSVIVVILSIIYLVKNLNFKGFLKSLSIPLSYIVVSYLAIASLGVISPRFDAGSSMIILLFEAPILFGLALIINLVIYLVGIFKKKTLN